MNNLLSLWRSPLDTVALASAAALADAQPRCDVTISQLPNQSPALADSVPFYQSATGNTCNATFNQIGSLIGGGSSFIGSTTDFSPLTIYNYGHYGAAGTASATTNTTALINMFSAMSTASSGSGGEAWIQQNNYQINFSGSGFTPSINSVIRALGTGGDGNHAPNSYHFIVNGDGTFFNMQGPHTSGGIYLWGLAIKAANPTLVSTTCCIVGQWNNRALKCNFTNWPCAYNAGGLVGNAGLSAGIEQCTIQYHTGSPVGSVSSISPTNHCLVPPNPYADASLFHPLMVTLSAPEVYCIGPGEMLQDSQSSSYPTSMANIMAIGVGGTGGSVPVEHAVIRDYHLSDFTWGISYIFQQTATNSSAKAGSKGTMVSFIECASWGSCVFMMNPDSSSDIHAEKYTSCLFTKSHHSDDASSIVYVDATTTGGTNSAVSDISFIDCTVYSDSDYAGTHGVGVAPANLYGYQLFTGTDIRILGGVVSNMGTGAGSANIAITGPISRVLIDSVRIADVYPNAFAQHASQYGILISGTPVDAVKISNCNISGSYGTANLGITGNLSNGGVFIDNCNFGASAVFSITGTISSGKLFIRNCSGYNDQHTVINAVGNIGTAARAAYNQGSNTGTNYYGPSYVFYTANAGGGTLSINGGATLTLANGQTGFFWLASPYDTFQFSAAPQFCQWIGN